MKKRIFSLCLVAALVAIAITGITLAYFTDTEAQVNTMITGNVSIDQKEWQDPNHEFPWVDGGRIVPNVPVGKYVTVKNDGTQDAYLRTLIAFEDTWQIGHQVDMTFVNGDYFVIPNEGNDWLQFHATFRDAENNVVDEAVFTVGVYTYGGEIVNPQSTAYSLYQLTLTSTATNEWSDYASGAYNAVENGRYEVVVLSQAAQTGSFDNADEALNTAFGTVGAADDATVAEWFESVLAEKYGAYTVECRPFSSDEYAEAIAAGEDVCGLMPPSWWN